MKLPVFLVQNLFQGSVELGAKGRPRVDRAVGPRVSCNRFGKASGLEDKPLLCV